MTAISTAPAPRFAVPRVAFGSVASRSVGTPQRATRLRLTVRGRRVLAFLAALPAIAALAFALLAGGSALAAGDAPATGSSFATVTVQSGDSLWGIAEELAPAADPRDVVDALVRLNALADGRLAVGQTLAIPAEYATP